ncbi:MAG: flagellar hook-associated protein FlgK, partial [Gammaproteobacteria bacterium]|nr:flagellar hook-associated protein FlgK [Gammaproteobacteria bacterium]
NNIANVNTDGYVRQELDIRENKPSRNGTVFLGSGATATGVKRAYDSLIEASMRSSNTDLSGQAPIIDFTNRLIDIMGGEKASLTPALDDFFGSFKALAQDPSSITRRNQVLSESENLASRFNELGNQFAAIDRESKTQLEYKVDQFNSLSEQLLTVNRKLSRQSDITRQPPDLLNARDKILADMSELLRISVKEEANGAVSASIGTTSSSIDFISKGSKKDIGIEYSTGTKPETASLLLDPFGESYNLSGLSGGEIGGTLQFRLNMLQPSWSELNLISRSLAEEVNNAMAGGMDLYGKKGSPVFGAPRSYELDLSMTNSNVGASVDVTQELPQNNNSLQFIFDKANSRWVITDQTSGQKYVSKSASSASINGLRVSFTGAPADGDVIDLKSFASEAMNMKVLYQDSKKIAAAELFGVKNAVTNLSSVRPRVSVFAAEKLTPDNALEKIIRNNLNESAAISISHSTIEPKTILGAGLKDVVLSMKKDRSSELNLQVFTKEGRHLFGTDDLTETNKSTMLTTDNGFRSGITYSDTYLNNASSYMGYDWKMGVVGKSVTEIDSTGTKKVTREAFIQTRGIPKIDGPGVIVPANSLKLNGNAMTELSVANGVSLSATAVVDWLTANINASGLAASMSAKAKNEIIIPANEVDFSGNTLVINGATVNVSSVSNMTDLINQINAQTDSENTVHARLGANQSLVLSNAAFQVETVTVGTLSAYNGSVSISDGTNSISGLTFSGGAPANVDALVTAIKAATNYSSLGFTVSKAANGTDIEYTWKTQGSQSGTATYVVAGATDEAISRGSAEAKTITFSSGSNVFTQVSGENQAGVVVSASRAAGDTSEKEIALTLGKTGSADILNKIGFNTSLYLGGAVQEDLVVFATAPADGSSNSDDVGQLFGEYKSTAVDPLSIRNRTTKFEFLTESQYRIIDTQSGTVLAERSYDGGGEIQYEAIKLTLDQPPVKGDIFSVDGNQAGVGSNENAIRIADLESKDVFGNDQNFFEAYLAILTSAGNLSNKATVAQEALEVVYNQAVQTKDQLAGVNLDEEAANLIRFQQAYQASARVMQTANQLFESLLRV